MDKNLDSQKIADLQKQIAELNKTIAKQNAIIEDYKQKEQSISSAIISSMEHANQLEASRRKLYALDIQRSRLMYLRMEQIINELYVRYPELKKDNHLRDMSEKFKTLVYDGLNSKEMGQNISFDVKAPVVDDPIKKLLHNIIDCYSKKEEPSPVAPLVNKSADPTADLMNTTSESGCSFAEALNPTMGLEEILNAFNLNAEDKNKK
ncbi:MAG: hypothetical protein MJ149_02470 [Clostridia bacterium]|nr:hypothetical protein [Clostridia bacterium]